MNISTIWPVREFPRWIGLSANSSVNFQSLARAPFSLEHLVYAFLSASRPPPPKKRVRIKHPFSCVFLSDTFTPLWCWFRNRNLKLDHRPINLGLILLAVCTSPELFSGGWSRRMATERLAAFCASDLFAIMVAFTQLSSSQLERTRFCNSLYCRIDTADIITLPLVKTSTLNGILSHIILEYTLTNRTTFIVRLSLYRKLAGNIFL